MKKSSSFKMTVLKCAGFVVMIIVLTLSPQAMMASGCSDWERIVAPDSCESPSFLPSTSKK